MTSGADSHRSDVEMGFRTHVGMVRSENQDHYGFHDPREDAVLYAKGRLLVVCDGMGGHNGGTVASRTTVDAILASFEGAERGHPKDLLLEAIATANAYVRDKGAKDPSLRNMGTTCVAAVVRGGACQIAHIGDSRAYILSPGGIRQVTRDHTYLNDLIDIGLLTPEKARHHPERNIITRCVGMGDSLQVDFIRVPMAVGEAVLLCSDGLYNHVEDEEMLEACSSAEPQVAAQNLIDLANQRGGEDNITVAILKLISINEKFEPVTPDEGDSQDTTSEYCTEQKTPVIEVPRGIPTPGPDLEGLSTDKHGDTTIRAIPDLGTTKKAAWKGWLVLIAIQLLILFVLQRILGGAG